MKKLLNLFVCGVVASFLATSCVFSAPLSVRLSDVVEYAENSQSVSDEEWELIKEDYFLLTEEFRANLSTYTDEEKQVVYELMGRMNGLIAKRGAGRFMEGLNELSTSLPAMIEGFVQGLTGENN